MITVKHYTGLGQWLSGESSHCLSTRAWGHIQKSRMAACGYNPRAKEEDSGSSMGLTVRPAEDTQ